MVGIQFLTHRLAKKKLVTLKAPRNTPNLPLFAPKIRKKILIIRFYSAPLMHSSSLENKAEL